MRNWINADLLMSLQHSFHFTQQPLATLSRVLVSHQNIPRQRYTQSAVWGNNRKWRVSLCQQMSWELTSGPLGILHLVMVTWPRTMPGPRWGSGVGIVYSGMICSDSKYLFCRMCVLFNGFRKPPRWSKLSWLRIRNIKWLELKLRISGLLYMFIC